jgi:antirestriction protein ArdC
MVTDEFLRCMEIEGVIPWIRDYKTSGIGRPWNPLSKQEYKGANFFTLFSMASRSGHQDMMFSTYKQVTEKGGTIAKGATMYPITYCSKVTKEARNASGEMEKTDYFFYKYYKAYDSNAIDGIEFSKPEPRNIVLSDYCEEIIQRCGVQTRNVGEKLQYDAINNVITLPVRDRFVSDDAYYASFFHLLARSTAEKMGRRTPQTLDQEAMEEMVCEMASSMLCCIAGINSRPTEKTASLIDPWIKALKKDDKYVIHASQRAQRTVNYLLGIVFED